MERDFRLDWQALVEEARRRRKAQRLTQQRLAAIADVSTPTVSRFEGGDKNLQLASALAILEVLGMTERSRIDFPDKAVTYDDLRDLVLFLARAGHDDVTCAISGEALEDRFDAKGTGRRARLAAFRAHRAEIEDLARRKLAARRLEPDGSILVRTADA